MTLLPLRLTGILIARHGCLYEDEDRANPNPCHHAVPFKVEPMAGVRLQCADFQSSSPILFFCGPYRNDKCALISAKLPWSRSEQVLWPLRLDKRNCRTGGSCVEYQVIRQCLYKAATRPGILLRNGSQLGLHAPNETRPAGELHTIRYGPDSRGSR